MPPDITESLERLGAQAAKPSKNLDGFEYTWVRTDDLRALLADHARLAKLAADHERLTALFAESEPSRLAWQKAGSDALVHNGHLNAEIERLTALLQEAEKVVGPFAAAYAYGQERGLPGMAALAKARKQTWAPDYEAARDFLNKLQAVKA